MHAQMVREGEEESRNSTFTKHKLVNISDAFQPVACIVGKWIGM